ncbi:MAG TPA: DMT family transporter [Methylomirabilota bacterium]|nr:DMT family transporter [Methylomirabilota bacterium]
MTHRDAYALLLVVALIWAGNFPLAKLGLAELGPLTLAALRALVAGPLLVLVSRALEGPLPRLARRDLTAVVVLAVTGFVGNSTLWYTGMWFTTPANAGILGAAAPVVVALAASAWLRERLSRTNLLGITLTMAAVMLTIAQGSFQVLLTVSANRGDVIILVSQMLWVAYTLYSRANRSTFSPLQMLAGAHVVAAGLLLPLALLEAPWRSFGSASWVAVVVVLYSALLGTPAHIAFYQAVRTVGPGRAAVFTNLIPFLVLGLSWLMVGEPIRWYHWVGACGVIAGVALTTRRAVSPHPPLPSGERAG